MTIENRINLEIDQAKRETIETGLAGFKTELIPLLVALSADNKRNLPMVGERLINFVEQAIKSADQNPDLIPPYIKLEGVKVDMETWKYMNALSKELEYIVSLLNDTAALSGSEAYSSMLSYYNFLKQAAKDGVPGAKPIYDNLKHHFSVAKNKTNTSPEVD